MTSFIAHFLVFNSFLINFVRRITTIVLKNDKRVVRPFEKVVYLLGFWSLVIFEYCRVVNKNYEFLRIQFITLKEMDFFKDINMLELIFLYFIYMIIACFILNFIDYALAHLKERKKTEILNNYWGVIDSLNKLDYVSQEDIDNSLKIFNDLTDTSLQILDLDCFRARVKNTITLKNQKTTELYIKGLRKKQNELANKFFLSLLNKEGQEIFSGCDFVKEENL